MPRQNTPFTHTPNPISTSISLPSPVCQSCVYLHGKPRVSSMTVTSRLRLSISTTLSGQSLLKDIICVTWKEQIWLLHSTELLHIVTVHRCRITICVVCRGTGCCFIQCRKSYSLLSWWTQNKNGWMRGTVHCVPFKVGWRMFLLDIFWPMCSNDQCSKDDVQKCGNISEILVKIWTIVNCQ